MKKLRQSRLRQPLSPPNRPRPLKQVNSAAFSEIVKGSFVTADTLASDDEFKKLAGEYGQFSAMYQSLSAGRLFAGKAVADSEPVALKLTVQMIRFAQHVQQAPYQLRARRLVLMS